MQRDNVAPDAFVGLGPLQDNLAVAGNLIYFSFVTLTSVGYGARTSSQEVLRLLILDFLLTPPLVLLRATIPYGRKNPEERQARDHALFLSRTVRRGRQ